MSESKDTCYCTVYSHITYVRQGIICKGDIEVMKGRYNGWEGWLTVCYPHWKKSLILSGSCPGPHVLAPDNPLRLKLTSMWDWLVNEGALPRKPQPVAATYEEIEGKPAELVESVRNDLARLRTKLLDLGRAYPLWDSFLSSGVGGITCVLGNLYSTRKEMLAHEARWGHEPRWLKFNNDATETLEECHKRPEAHD